MDNLPVGLQHSEDDILAYWISDEALETAAASVRHGVGSFTISFCSGLDTCPA
jgi:hypothetical protein